MRKAFFDTLNVQTSIHKDLIFLTADLGFGFVEEFKENHPKNFLNVGVAEQSMLGLANGLAVYGRKVICYSIAAFSLLRPFEFFRNGAIAQNSAVMVVGVGPGFDYSNDGISHYCLEDLALLQSQPGVAIKTPFTEDGVRMCIIDFLEKPNPTYLRLPRSVTPLNIHDLAENNPEDTDVLIICTALMGERAKLIETKLKEFNLSTKIGSINELSLEVDQKIIQHLIKAKKCLVIEDHYEFGGLATRIGNLILENKLKTILIKDGVIEVPRGTIGSFKFMENKIMKSIPEILTIILN